MHEEGTCILVSIQLVRIFFTRILHSRFFTEPVKEVSHRIVYRYLDKENFQNLTGMFLQHPWGLWPG